MRRTLSLPLAVLAFFVYNAFVFKWSRDCPESFRQLEVSDLPDTLGDTQNSTLGVGIMLLFGAKYAKIAMLSSRKYLPLGSAIEQTNAMQ